MNVPCLTNQVAKAQSVVAAENNGCKNIHDLYGGQTRAKSFHFFFHFKWLLYETKASRYFITPSFCFYKIAMEHPKQRNRLLSLTNQKSTITENFRY